jgi:hypothetical protein
VAGPGPGAASVVNEGQLEVLRLLVDRGRSLGDKHTRKTSQLHQLLLELIPSCAEATLLIRVSSSAGADSRHLHVGQVDEATCFLQVSTP